jgi:ribonucleoside-diphosphate reductase alpha chain
MQTMTHNEASELQIYQDLKKMERVVDKRPSMLEGKTYDIRADGKKWYLTINLNNDKPYEIFIKTNSRDSSANIADAIDKLDSLGELFGIEDIFITEQHLKSKNEPNTGKFSRAVSLLLRHEVPVDRIVDVLNALDHNVTNITYHVAKRLALYIKNKKIEKCPSCNEMSLVYEAGCKSCVNCGWSKC